MESEGGGHGVRSSDGGGGKFARQCARRYPSGRVSILNGVYHRGKMWMGKG